MEKRFHETLERLARLEQAFSITEEETAQKILQSNAKIEAIEERLSALENQYNVAVARFNEAVATINTLNDRVSALEANYDPTVIE